MRNKAYTLDAAQRLREGRRTKAEAALGITRVELEHAQAKSEQLERALQVELAKTPAAPGTVSHQSSALELQRTAAYAQRHNASIERLRVELTRAQDLVDERRSALLRAQDVLAQTHADELAIVRDRERRQNEQRREHERAEQLELEEQLARARGKQER